MKAYCWLAPIWLLWGLLVLAPAAHAHRVTVFAWVEGGTVHTQSKFSGGKRVQGGKIEVHNAQGIKLLEGTTDEQGYFAFPVPKANEIKVDLTAGMGHSNHWVVRADELGFVQSDPTRETKISAAPLTPPGHAAPAAQACLNAKTVEQIVERALEKKLAPIRAQLAEQNWGLRDIVAGFGYILGLMGLGSYIHHRKEKK